MLLVDVASNGEMRMPQGLSADKIHRKDSTPCPEKHAIPDGELINSHSFSRQGFLLQAVSLDYPLCSVLTKRETHCTNRSHTFVDKVSGC